MIYDFKTLQIVKKIPSNVFIKLSIKSFSVIRMVISLRRSMNTFLLITINGKRAYLVDVSEERCQLQVTTIAKTIVLNTELDINIMNYRHFEYYSRIFIPTLS